MNTDPLQPLGTCDEPLHELIGHDGGHYKIGLVVPCINWRPLVGQEPTKGNRMDEWKPRYLVEKAPGVGGEPIDADEPVVVIRAQDELALLMIDQYLLLYRTFYEHFGTGADWRVIGELERHRDMVERWQSDHPDHVKMADR